MRKVFLTILVILMVVTSVFAERQYVPITNMALFEKCKTSTETLINIKKAERKTASGIKAAVLDEVIAAKQDILDVFIWEEQHFKPRDGYEQTLSLEEYETYEKMWDAATARSDKARELYDIVKLQ